ncbi:peptidoglycan-binding protein [Tetzosporium hominis]|uniref:Peptidoglycan-binding protein n=1 Tax=Tetzosporium hominis TaxID=2020506 RepID=A0A264W495_9BACL|nr:3D domain-containing protein [Tetzosporium hominis]OZS77857.1 peptidoglycan-binding protein [Tetzosporium hominis]
MKKQIVALTAISGLFIGAAGASAAEQLYTVKSGDTLWSIAQENQVSVGDIQEWNNLDSTLIFPKQELQVGEFETYTVVSGDTLYQIAQQHNISVADLKGWNGLTSDLIFPEQKLFVEGTDYKAPQAQAAASSEQQVAVSAPVEQAQAPQEQAEEQAPVESQETSQAPAEATQTLTVEATAYTAYCEGCSGTTATGIDLRANPGMKVIAVDPNVIPLGSKVWVEGYGEAIAGDTGGAIKGNKIDIFMPDQQDALNWGRQTITVKILD